MGKVVRSEGHSAFTKLFVLVEYWYKHFRNYMLYGKSLAICQCPLWWMCPPKYCFTFRNNPHQNSYEVVIYYEVVICRIFSQFSSVTQSRLTLCNPMDCSTPGLPVIHQLQEFTQTHVHWVGDATQPSHTLSSPSPLPSIFPSIRGFSMSWFFASGAQSIGFSASASVLPINIQDLFPWGWTGWISLLS